MCEREKYSIEWVSGDEYTQRIANFLLEVDETFIPRLSDRVDIAEYAKKLAKNAETVFVYCGKEDIASCSVYCNTKEGYISSFAVREGDARKGIGAMMMNEVIRQCQKHGCTELRLEVYDANERAKYFYKKMGFAVKTYSEDSIFLQRKLSAECS